MDWHWGDNLVDAGSGGGGGGGGGGGDRGAGFSDVAPHAWYLPALAWGLEAGIVSGYDDDTFRPGGQITRAQSVMWLWSLAGRPAPGGTASFSDVSTEAWFADALDWAARAGVVSGFPDGTYRPRSPVNRGQLAAMMWNVAGRPAPPGTGTSSDVRPTAWYAPAVAWLTEMGYATGFPGGAFRPGEDVKRAQGLNWLHAARPLDDVAPAP